MKVQCRALFSGSRGNATLVQAGGVRLLVDAGVSALRLERALRSAGVQPGELDAVLLTHEHTDHVAGLNVFAARYGTRVYANAPTWGALGAKADSLSPAQRVIIGADCDFFIGGLNIEACSTAHDCAQGTGYIFCYGGVRAAVVTDLGCMTRTLLNRLEGCRAVLLESNHDEQMLLQGPYPQHLKKRICGKRGHLSNRMAGNVLGHLARMGLQQAALLHLSDENNTPDLALHTVQAALREGGAPALRVLVASQDAPCDPIEL